jgi:hypothetical protein
MKNSKYFIVISTLVVLFVFSCKRDSPPVYPDYRISVPQVLLDYGYFKTGTYWVYQDTASLSLDSVYVTSFDQGTHYTTPSNNSPYSGYYGYYDVYSQDPFEGRQYHNWVNTEFTFGELSTLYEDKIINYDSLKETWLMTDHFVNGQPDPNGGYPVDYENQYDSLKIQNVYFKNVLFFQDGKNATQNNSITNTYLAKNVGVIRKEILLTHKVWNLVRYHIVQ